MENAARNRQQAIDTENSASKVLEEAECLLLELPDQHRAGSPTMDNCVTDLAMRRRELDQAMYAADLADAFYHDLLLGSFLDDRRTSRVDHRQRLQDMTMAQRQHDHVASNHLLLQRRRQALRPLSRQTPNTQGMMG
ncbi:hypothetical protein PHYPSEUDO_011948 [Phytophthora pseudosyringae]|uniref:Uncharacterized protein n=1 Tax=Phytophthora pseudosyringae TaxID=221518 RepID=A0A8T1VAY3_9STRA|nr:hypothetical protein PHYPSEUDO_011948 [Phytophthora pseudosyringae]